MAKKKVPFILTICFIAFSLFSCKNNNKETLQGSICDTTDTKFSTFVNPFIINNCSVCHSASNAPALGGGINLEGYANINAMYSSIIVSISRANLPMPKGGSRLDACTITKFQTWINRGAQNN